MWSREASTVNGNLSSLKRAHLTKKKFRLKTLFPQMGPFPLDDSMGMGEAIAVLDGSLDKGKCDAFVQWATLRKTRSRLTDIGQASLCGLADSIGACEQSRLWMSGAPTHSFFFFRFMMGLHRRIGEIVKPDEPITIDILHAILRILETECLRASSSDAPNRMDKLMDVSRIGAWHVIGFCASSRGEEMPLMIELAGTKESLRHLNTPPPGQVPHSRVVITGPTKNNREQGRKFFLPIAAVTEGTNVPAGKWVQRSMAAIGRSGRTTGPLFQKLLDAPKMKEFGEEFMNPLEVASTVKPNPFPSKINIREDFGICRSLRRGSTAHATNVKVRTPVIDSVNQWRRERKSDDASLPVRQHHTKLEALLPTLLECSRALWALAQPLAEHGLLPPVGLLLQGVVFCLVVLISLSQPNL